jgi:quinol monooxygenase YgiN
MSETIYWVLALKINPGKAEEFKVLSEKMIESTRQETGTLNYEWTLSPDGETCHIYERYVDSAAILTHIERNGEMVGRLFGIVTPVSFFIYGSPSEAIRKDLAGLNPVYMTPLGGFAR